MKPRQRQKRPVDKAKAKAQAEGKATLDQTTAEVEAALKLLDQETADGIIGQQTAEYKTLIRGTQGVFGLLWPMMKGQGVKQSGASLKAVAQAMGMALTIVHYAYALGVKRGRTLAQKENQEPAGG